MYAASAIATPIIPSTYPDVLMTIIPSSNFGRTAERQRYVSHHADGVIREQPALLRTIRTILRTVAQGINPSAHYGSG